jgi:hypothetical protein
MNSTDSSNTSAEESCTAGLTRKQFINRVVNKASIAGVLIVSASLFEKYQPAAATPPGSVGPPPA